MFAFGNPAGGTIRTIESTVDATAKNFTMKEVSADKAYISEKNLQTVVDHNAMPYIPFRSNNRSR
jgi:hypothetical protein